MGVQSHIYGKLPDLGLLPYLRNYHHLHLPFHTGVWLPEKELVEFKGRRLVSVEPHCVACRLP